MSELSPTSLRGLKLRAGMFLQAHGVGENARHYETHYLGAIEGKCVMIVPVGQFDRVFGMKSGETYVMRGFDGQYDFHFTSTVINAFDYTFKVPAYAYAVISYPVLVEAKKVRNAVRIKTSLPARATPHGAANPVRVTVLDLSAEGALVRSASVLGALGDLVRLDFTTDSDTPPHLLTLARICHTNERPGDEGILTGLVFETISASARVTVKDFVLSHLE
ncbi:MAG TPA: PilZ domain-containing protein [Burkholderiales bacterium]|nr:PilZ domain-containing protein [Burkholderiales bacterium]